MQPCAASPTCPPPACRPPAGADFPAAGAGLPRVRQFPQAATAVLDDKRLMAETLEAAGCAAAVAPSTWPDAGAFARQHSGGSAAGSGSSTAAAPAGQQAGLWFLKHRHGVKGKSVYVFESLPALLRRIQSMDSSGGAPSQHFMVQRGVAPLLLPDRRKFTLRAHVLLLLDNGEQAQQQQQAAQPQRAALRAWVHEDVIATPHAKPTEVQDAAGAAPAAAEADAGVHVSSHGRGHPQPFLLPQLALQLAQQSSDSAAALQQDLWRQVCSTSRAAVEAAAPRGLVPPGADPAAVLYHLWAFDFAVGVAEGGPAAGGPAAGAAQAAGAARDAEPLRPRVWLLEANAYPAIASGTMSAVPRSVYTRLVGDLLGLVVLPALGGGGRVGAVAGGFRVL